MAPSSSSDGTAQPAALLLVEVLLMGGVLAGVVLWQRHKRSSLVKIRLEDGMNKYFLVGRRNSRSGVLSFKGVPYAAPPVGLRRFKKPSPYTPPEQFHMLECLEYGPGSVQLYPMHALLYVPKWLAVVRYLSLKVTGRLPKFNTNPRKPLPLVHGVSEDCLYLDINTPTTDPEAKLPVMVWFHGGAYMFGQGTERPWTVHENDSIVKRGVVNVAVNYRLGLLGFTKVEGGDWNCGSWDQVAALEWVRRNISAFGGDPLNVTIYGESAGAISCTILAAAGYGEKLFHRMILASGAWQMGMSVAQSEATGREIAKALNMPYPLYHADLIHIPADALLAAQTAAVEGCNAGHMPYQPVIEGELLTDHPATLLHKGAAKGVPALIAYHEEEEAFFALVMPKLYKSVDRRDCLEKIVFTLGPACADLPNATSLALSILSELQSLVGPERAEDWTYLTILYSGYLRFAAVALHLGEALRSNGSPVYLARFLVPSPSFNNRCAHVVDLPYVFGNWRRWGPVVPAGQFKAQEHDLLTEAVQQAWTTFASTGKPSVASVKEWPELPRKGAKKDEPHMQMQFEMPFRGRLEACRMREQLPTLWKVVEGLREAYFVWNVANRPLFVGVPVVKGEGPKPKDYHLLDA